MSNATWDSSAEDFGQKVDLTVCEKIRYFSHLGLVQPRSLILDPTCLEPGNCNLKPALLHKLVRFKFLHLWFVFKVFN